jgi:hypothetical protein
VRGSSPAPGRLDEIDMGVSVGGGSSPLTSPIREWGEGGGAPWDVREVRVKREEVEVRMEDVRREGEGAQEKNREDKEKEKEKVEVEEGKGKDVEMPLAMGKRFLLSF